MSVTAAMKQGRPLLPEASRLRLCSGNIFLLQVMGENVLWCDVPCPWNLDYEYRCRWLSLNTPVLIKRCNVEPPSSPSLQQLPTEVFSISSVSFSRPWLGLETNFINWYLQLSVHQTMDFILLAKHTTHLDTSSCNIRLILCCWYRNQVKFWTNRWINAGGASNGTN